MKYVNRLCGVMLAIVVAMLYGQFLSNPIIFDDLQFFGVDEKNIQNLDRYHFSLGELRSLPYATLSWTKNSFGLDIVNFRIGNLILHALVVLVLFYLLRKMYVGVLCKENLQPDSRLTAIAFFSALWFGLHPVATYGAGYLVQRTILMATLFSLLSILCYVKGSIQNNSLWMWLSAPLFYLAILSKEHAVMLPVTLVAITVLLHEDWRFKILERRRLVLVLVAIMAYVILTKVGIIGSVYEVNATSLVESEQNKMAYPLSIFTQTLMFFKYILLWVAPNAKQMSIDMRVPFAASFISNYFLTFWLFIIWGVLAFWLLLKRGGLGLLGFSLLYPWLMFFTEFSTVRIQEVFVLYRSYLWMPGLFFIPLIVSKYVKMRIIVIVGVAVSVLFFILSMERLITMSHPLLLWNDAEKLVNGRPEVPGAARIYYNRGSEFVHAGEFELAEADLKYALKLSPNYVEAQVNLGATYFKRKEWQAAIESFDLANKMYERKGLNLQPFFIHQRGQAFEFLGLISDAKRDFAESCRLAKLGCERID